MKDRITLALEGVGAGLFWILASFTLLIFTAPFFWVGESLSDLRWPMGIAALLPALPGIFFLPRRRLTFVALAAMGVINALPGIWVLMPRESEIFSGGTQLSVLEVHWGDAPTAALEERILVSPPDLLIVSGLTQEGRESLQERLVDWPYIETWPPQFVDDEGEAQPVREDSTMIFSKLKLEDFTVQSFDQGAALMEGNLEVDQYPLVLRIAVMPAPGPGAIGAARDALLAELEHRVWTERGLLFCDLASADTAPAYHSVMDTSGYEDARRGFGRMPTERARLFGAHLPALWVPGAYLLHGKEIEVLNRKPEALVAAERDLIGLKHDTSAPKILPVRTQLRIESRDQKIE